MSGGGVCCARARVRVCVCACVCHGGGTNLTPRIPWRTVLLRVQLAATTSTVMLVDDVLPQEASVGPKTQLRSNSAVHITLTKEPSR